MSVYSLNARVIQKKDQLEELSETGAIIPAPVVEEVRTGQQFLIKLHLVKTRPTPSPAFPSLRVGRREAINTAGESRTDPEPLTLEIFVHLAKSGQIRQGACAKCCHKYGPASPILVLLDPLSPSVTDPLNYAHVDTTSGSITLLAKVVCSSTDHGERGNKDRYIFEFRLKRTSTMPLTALVAMDTAEDVGESIAACFTPPIMCSGHHKAKRTYPHQRPSKTSKGAPTPKVKTIKRHKSAPNIMHEPYGGDSQPHAGSSSSNSSSMHRNLDHHSGLSFLPEDLSQGAMADPYRSRSNEATLNSVNAEDFLMTSAQSSSHPLQQQLQVQYPRVLEVRPDHGPIRKTTDVVLRGLFFQEGMVPYFGCFPAQDIVVETSQLILCKAPESPLPGTVGISIYDNMGNNYSDLGQFTYTDDSETELLILQLQLRLAHRALEYLHAQATGKKGNAVDILREIPGLASSSPRAGGALMMEATEGSSGDSAPFMSLSQVEEGILSTLDHLPREIDISLQLEDGSNLLHLSILLGFNTLTRRLIEDGCDLEARDAWSMTPLRYAVLRGNEAMARELVLAGASSSGAKSPQEFYSHLPYSAPQTPAMVAFLAISCQRFSQTGGSWASDIDSDTLMEADEGEERVDNTADSDIKESSSSNSTLIQTVQGGSEENNSESDVTMSTLADAIHRVRVSQGIPPLDQQDLPPLQTVQDDGSIKINSKVIKGSDIPTPNDAGPSAIANPESGYHSGVYSAVQERLERSHLATLPSKDIQLGVTFKRPPESSASPTRPVSITAMPLELFRTGDSFTVEIKIEADPLVQSGEGKPTLPKEFLGIRLPQEMMKRTSGRAASILTDMTYGLNVSIELGHGGSPQEPGHKGHGDGILLNGSCQACSKYLHEHRKLSPSRRPTADPFVYPIIQFNVPGGSGSTVGQAGAGQRNNAGVVELRDGRCELKARVNCSSLHHLIQRERARRSAELKRRKAAQEADSTGAASSSSPSPPLMALADLEDPGFVFKFDLVHPTTKEIVASHSTLPTLFQSYPRGRN
ncbi:hypothetical protein EMPS_09321 [Entomortierella parvispora]|uniref:IPT/TIG domain-containing protein n=1 Tax=Entomortierella parvispora TaxID=205924 RepID=A0A9P3HHZ0_9FUNG|nr:hypothetical protein EMPS_09321 [Entomortierella parvispora]